MSYGGTPIHRLSTVSVAAVDGEARSIRAAMVAIAAPSALDCSGAGCLASRPLSFAPTPRPLRAFLRQDSALVALALVQVRVYDAIVVEGLEPLVEVQVHDVVPRIYGIFDAVVSRIKQHLKVPVFECDRLERVEGGLRLVQLWFGKQERSRLLDNGPQGELFGCAREPLHTRLAQLPRDREHAHKETLSE